MSARSQFLASMARHQFDGDSDSSEDHSNSCGDSSDDDAREAIKEVTPPRSGAIGGGKGGIMGTPAAKEALLSSVAPPPPPPQPAATSPMLGRRRSPMRTNDKTKGKQPPAAAPTIDKTKKLPVAPMTRTACPPSPSSTLRRAAHRRNKQVSNTLENTDEQNAPPPRSPPRRGAHHVRSSSFDVISPKTHHVRSDSFDAKSSGSSARTNKGSQHRRVVDLPKSLQNLGTLDAKSSASSFEWGDDISVAASVMSTASIASALSTISSTSCGSHPPVAPPPPGAKSLVKLRGVRSGRGGLLLDDITESKSVKAKKGFKKKAAYFSNDDTSTVTTEATALESISYCRSNDSQTIKRSSSTSKELDRLKRLSIGGLKPKCDPSDDASVATSEGYEVSIFPNRSEISEQFSDEVSPNSGSSRLADRLKKLKNVSPKNSRKNGDKKCLDSSVKEMRNRRVGGRLSRSVSTDRNRMENKGAGGGAGESKRTETIEQEAKTPIRTGGSGYQKRTVRSTSTGRPSAREAASKSKAPSEKGAKPFLSPVSKRAMYRDRSRSMEKKVAEAVSKATSEKGAKPIDAPVAPVSKRAMFRGRSLSRSRSSTTVDSVDSGDSGKDVYVAPSRAIRSTISAASPTGEVELLTSTPSTPPRASLKFGGRRNRSGDRSKEIAKEVKPPLPKPYVVPGEKKLMSSARTPERYGNRHGKEKEATPSNDTGDQAKDTSAMSSRAGRRRSRSISRSSGIQTPTTPPKRSYSSTKRVDAQSPKKSKEPSPKTPPRYMRKAHTTLKTPPRTMVAHEEITAPIVPLSPLMKSSHRHRLSPKSMPKTQNSFHRGAAAATRSTVNHFDILKPSKLASLSISVLCKAVLPIQRLSRQYVAKIAVEKRQKSIVKVQSLIRRWVCVRYLKSAKMIALRCQGAYQGMIARGNLDFQHYCASRVQATFRGFLGFLAFMEALSRIILLQSIWRMKRQRKRYVIYTEGEKLRIQMEVELLKNVTFAQSIVRRWIAMKSYREQRETKAALVIQTNFRGYKAMVDFLFTVSDVVLCQAAVRQFLALKRAATLRYIRDTKAALLIQTNFRRHKAMVDLLYSMTDVIQCQATVRRFLALKHTTQLREVKCATKIQATWRRYLASEYFIFMLSDVIVCQSVIRRKIAMKRYDEMLVTREVSAVSIQKIYRGYNERVNYHVMIADVITAQSTIRRWVAMRQLYILRQIQWAKEEDAATKIRAAYLGYMARINYLITVDNIITCQCAVRRMIARKELHERRQLQWAQDFVKKEIAATKIRSTYLGYIARINYLITVNKEIAATKIRATYLGYITRIHYLIKISNVISCQCEVRKIIARKRLEDLRHSKRERAATKIRSAYLGYITRIDYFITISDMITIQCAVRKMIARKELEKLRQIQCAKEGTAATKIRSVFIGYVVRMDYFITISSVIMCQGAVRKMIAKKELNTRRQIQWAKEDAAATKIRSAYVGYITRIDYLVTVSSVITCQSVVRKMLARKELAALLYAKRERAATKIRAVYLGFTARLNYIFTVADVITVQKSYRGYRARKMMEGLVGSATKIQAMLRGALARRAFEHVMESREIAAITIQKMYRGFVDYQGHITKLASSIHCQAVIRQFLAKKELARRRRWRSINENATKIQSCWRSHKAQTDFAYTMESTMKVQAMVRGMLIRRAFERLRESRENAAVMIQKMYRGFAAFENYVVNLASTIYCQAVIRQFLAKKEFARRRRWRSINENATRIQSCWRSYKAHTDFAYTMWSTTKVQAMVRGMLARRAFERLRESRENAAVMIQKMYRGFVAFEDYVVNLASTIYCQAVIRQFLAKKEFARRRHWRSINENATRIQSCWRSYKAHTDFAYAIWSVISLQSRIRCRLTVRKYQQLRWRTVNESVTRIQSCYRAYKTRTDFAYVIWGIICLQSLIRCRLTVRKYQLVQIRRESAAVTIQSALRTHLHYTEYITEIVSAITIQSCFRMWAALKEKRRRAQLFCSAIKLQSVFRRHLTILRVIELREFRAMCKAQNLMNVENVACLAAQKWWRHVLLQRNLAEDERIIKMIILENKAATAIQTCFRGYRDFVSYVVKQFFVIKIQACTRGYLAKCLLKRLMKQEREKEIEQERMILQNVAATAIQSCFRGYQDFVGYLMKNYSTIEIQTQVRGYQARCHLQRLKQKNFSIIQIQTRVRGYQARCHLLRLAQEKQEEKRMFLQNTAATAIQTCFRGYQDFLRFVIMQYFAIKIQACIRGYQARCRLKRLKQEDRDKKIKKSQRLNDALSRVSSSHVKKNRPRAAGDVSLSSLSLSSNKKKHIPIRREQREKKAALVIERFFIKIRAEIEFEITRLEKKKMAPKHKGDKRKVRANQPSSRIGNPSSISSAYSFSGYSASSMPSPRKEPTSASHPPSGFNSASHNGGPSKKSPLTPSQRRPSSVRRVKDAEAEQTPSQSRRVNSATEPTPLQVRQHSTEDSGQDLLNSYPRHNAMINASPLRERMPLIQSVKAMRNTPPSRERMPSVQPVNAKRNEGSNAVSKKNSGNDLRNSQPPRKDMRNASPTRERMPQHDNAMRNASPSRERMPPMQSVAQHGGCKSTPTPTINQAPMHTSSPSSFAGHHNAMRNASPSRERMPIQSAVQHGGYKSTPTSTFNQAPMHTSSPSSHSNPPPPNLYPPFNHNVNHQQTPKHDPPHCAYIPQSNSFASASHHYNHPPTRSRHSATNPIQHQMQNPPLSCSNHSVSSINHHQQHQMHNSYQSATTPMRGHYAEHQRRPDQSQTPTQAQQSSNMQPYQNNYTRY